MDPSNANELTIGAMTSPRQDLTSSPPRILLVENDPHLTNALVEGLATHGVRLLPTRHPVEAIARLRSDIFSLVLTDHRFGSTEDSEHIALKLLEAAESTPVACVTGSDLPRHLTRRYAFVVTKPFTLEHLLLNIAPWTVVQSPQDSRTEIIRRYFYYLSTRDWNAVAELCAHSVQYNPPAGVDWGKTIYGRSAFREHTEEIFRTFPYAKFELLQIYWLPLGAIARFRSEWRGPRPGRLDDGLVLFKFEGLSIAKIGVELNGFWQQALFVKR